MDEKWAPIKGFDDYEVSDHGRVYNKRSDLFCSLSEATGGGVRVNLASARQNHTRSVLRLVAEAFVPKHELEGFDTPMQLDGDPWNLMASNIVWRPRWYVMKWTQEWPYSERYLSGPVYNMTRGKVYPSVVDAAMGDGVLMEHIMESCYVGEPVMMLHYSYAFVDGQRR